MSDLSLLVQAQVMNALYDRVACEACYRIGTRLHKLDGDDNETITACIDVDECMKYWEGYTPE